MKSKNGRTQCLFWKKRVSLEDYKKITLKMESRKFYNRELSRVFTLGIAHERLDIVF
jgi:hypothetical protein